MRVKYRLRLWTLAAFLAVADISLADQFDCESADGHARISLRIDIPGHPAGARVYLDGRELVFAPPEQKGSIILFSEMGPGSDDERFITYRMLRFDQETGELNYIQHIPDFKHIQAHCTLH